MYSVWLSQEEQRIWRSYLAMVSALDRAMNRQLQADCGLSRSDYDVLVTLAEGGPLRMNALGEVLGWEQSRLSHQLRRMRDRGLVNRSGAAEDRRGATVSLAAAGRAALRKAAPGHAALVHGLVFEAMTAAERETFGAVVEGVLQRALSAP
ncbi:MarR family winged helix-turn-helix transcriptional regulator [Mycolicibacterium sp. F2034L]|uniref:MarR family winged helix-turn-helix transcriptional regulator n=1 Tax=Mycolicibacterium sp. F2034L TaxID=2926422 RepID=UPI001FF4C67C|nr:MarR family winged helix-turn-helix transcriptional regulator [Mycolicibacterium sp. F2034L]MCK0177092.1 MarR family winged helix-turn-helix transcriptional regulator [Mycolicibacterium sp. F2034L]